MTFMTWEFKKIEVEEQGCSWEIIEYMIVYS
jgi:hypothetical protein